MDRMQQFVSQLDRLSRLASPAVVLGVRSAGAAVEQSRRRDLLRALRSGEVVELELSIVATRDPVKPRPLPRSLSRLANANFTRFRDGEHAPFGASFAGRPFLRDHSQAHADRGGRIGASSSTLETGEWITRQAVQLVKPWAVEDALDGTMETFSIGWQPKRGGVAGLVASAYCTVCDGPMFGSDCRHWPGDVAKRGGQEYVVELEWRDVVGRETSAVTFPAVQGTGIEAVDALAAMSTVRPAPIAPAASPMFTVANMTDGDRRCAESLGLNPQQYIELVNGPDRPQLSDEERLRHWHADQEKAAAAAAELQRRQHEARERPASGGRRR